MAQPLNEKVMSFYEHIEELRTRLMRCLWVFFGGFGLCYLASDQLLAVLRVPLFKALPPEQQKLYFTSLFENFLMHLKIAGYGSLVLLSPYFFYQVWGFIAPGLKDRERKMVFPFVSAATAFFVGGVCFAYWVVFPVGFKYFITYGGPTDVPLITISSYYDTCLKLMVLFGVAFELPVFVIFLGALGVVDAPFLRQHRRTAIMIITIFSALFAPPDAMSMLLLGGPLVLLFEASIFVVQWLGMRKKAEPETPVPSAFTGRSDSP